MKSMKFLSFSMAVCMICLLTMTSRSAAEVPAASGGAGMDSAKLTSETQPVSTFSDVPAGAWYAEAVGWCLDNGLIDGTSDTAFSPDSPATRAVLAGALYRKAESPKTDTRNFSDIRAGAWYAQAASWTAAEGIIGGYSDGRFGGEDSVTRQQLAVILWRSAGKPVPAKDGAFADQAQIAAYATDASAWAQEQGIINGKAGNNFDPHGTATRAQLAVMLHRWMTGTEKQEDSMNRAKTLVAYFSATNTTRPLAEYAADILGADLVEIVPEVPYTDADLAYYTNGRADREQNDSSARPTISGSVENMADYDVIFLGYPIWHGQPPRIISTFLESYDFAGKTIVPFCTSHSSGYSDSSIKSLAPGANWITGRRFAGGTSRGTMEEWINGLELPKPSVPATNPAAFNFETKSVTLNSGYDMPINGLGTYSLHRETCVNAVKSALASGVRLIDTASAYGNEEEVGQAIREAIDEGIIKREDVFVITKIYPGSEMANPEQSIQACLDRLDIDYVDMMLLHHPDRNDAKAYQAMEKFVEEGKIRSLGLSNWYVKELGEFLPQVTITPALVQNEIHPYYQENDVIPYIQDLGIVVQGWYPLGGRGHTAELLGDEVISGIAKAHGVSSAQVILRWNLQKGVVVIPGSSNPDHIKENTELYGFELTDAEMAQINALDRNEKHDWY